MNRCIDINPEEPLFHYMKAFWKEGHLFILTALKKVNADEIEALKKSILEDASKAIELAQEWEEPRKHFGEIVRQGQW